MNNELLYEVNDGIAVITINRPERRNALNRAVREGFFEVWRRFEADGQAQVAILTGAGGAFFRFTVGDGTVNIRKATQ